MEKDKKTKGKKVVDGEGGEDVEPEDKEFLELVRRWCLIFLGQTDRLIAW